MHGHGSNDAGIRAIAFQVIKHPIADFRATFPGRAARRKRYWAGNGRRPLGWNLPDHVRGAD